ncbi:MAG: NAD-glutamate dehydrogenase, partial [Simkaniaceae bacterium]|nr:NAD-glutamate dehydrogenase [Simkaniaceae bacterium]
FEGASEKLRIAFIHFTEYLPVDFDLDALLPEKKRAQIYDQARAVNPDLTEDLYMELLKGMNPRFLTSLSDERLILALNLFCHALTRDHCQYEVKYNEDWQTTEGNTPSMQILLAWRNTPKHQFLYRLSKIVFRHKLIMKRVNATYINPYSSNSILLMSIGLHGQHNKAAWDAANIHDFLQELTTLKYFIEFPTIEKTFVDSHMVSGNLGNFLKVSIRFVHQMLLHADPNLYSLEHIEEGFCRHPELTRSLCQIFEYRFHPTKHNQEHYATAKQKFLENVHNLDTGQVLMDTRRKNILLQSLYFIDKTLKTNFFRTNKSGFSFRIDPSILKTLPFDYRKKFPEPPYGIFYINGFNFIGFHIRFEDLARGGLRTVIPRRKEQTEVERNNVFAECYNLAYTQHKKNKDIPEGGSKAIIFIDPFETQAQAERIYFDELTRAKVDEEEIEKRLEHYRNEQRLVYLYQSQRAFVHSLLTIVNCNEDGTLKARDTLDYLKQPEYLYLGPDENMHNEMIVWIAEYARHTGYKPGASFISSKPSTGINHKEYGVTSLGVNVYMHEVLLYLGINPETEPFTIKISGGPDGDVAGNQILNLYHFYKKTAKLLALTDVSGTIYDPDGLDLDQLAELFYQAKPLRFYPPELLNDNGFMLDLFSKREESKFTQLTLLWKKTDGKLVQEWISGNEMNHILRHNLHQTIVDIFIPGGGRPRTLNESNYEEYLDETGKPTSKAIIEGANLYLTPEARYALEDKGVIIIKDSSANKGGVICSSCEVLTGLTMQDQEFLDSKPEIMEEILNFIRQKARLEARLILHTHDQSHESLIDISDKISEKINAYTYAILNHLKKIKLSDDPDDALNLCLFNYLIPMIRNEFADRVINNIPDIHKKAIISCYLASNLIYERGPDWSPNIVDILPLIISKYTHEA